MSSVGVDAGVAQTTRTFDVSPNTGLTTGDIVQATGGGFPPSVDVGVCQGVVDGTPDLGDCGAGLAGLLQSDETGAFSVPFTVRRFLTIRGQQVDCAAAGAACVVAAAEFNDIANTTVVVPLVFAPVSGTPRPDLIFRNRATQQLFEDNQYFTDVSHAPQHSHFIVAGGNWTFALLVQNDGDVADDLILSAPIISSGPFEVRYFVGYYDVTTAVNGSGLTFHNVAPGQSFVFAVQFRAGVGAAGSGVLASLKLTSGSAPELVDFARTWVKATAST